MTDLAWWIIEQKTHDEILKILKDQSVFRPWATYFLRDNPMTPGNLSSTCRIGFVPYRQCVQDRYFYVDQSRNPEILAAGGITTQIRWDGQPENLPAGWQGAVKQSFVDDRTKCCSANTQVALLAFTTQRFRQKGLSGKVLTKMCSTAQKRGYPRLIVPALPPTQFQKEFALSSMKAISELKGDNGQYYDYWIRLHTQKGATIIGYCEHSHRFVFNIEDFAAYVSSDPIKSTGEHIVRLDKDSTWGPKNRNMWQLVYADVERSFIAFNWGCIWVQYDLRVLDFSSVE